jgi:hypothetical protein
VAGLFDDFDPITNIPGNQFGVATGKISRGSLLSFHYPESHAKPPNVIHDFYPMVIITDVWPNFIRGVNLHYLTFPYIKKLLQAHGGKSSAQYTSSDISGDKYVANAFRMYYIIGVKQARSLDVEFLLNILATARSFSPNEIEKIKKEIEAQIQQRLQAKADELTSYEEWRAGMERSQRTALDRRLQQLRESATRGVQEGLITPAAQGIANIPPLPGEGGAYSTDPNL